MILPERLSSFVSNTVGARIDRCRRSGGSACCYYYLLDLLAL